VSDDSIRRLGEILPANVSEAVDCPEDPWIGPPVDGDFEIRFRSKSALDVGGMNCVIEVKTKLFQSREQDKHRRSELIHRRLSSTVELGKLGVWLILSEGAWSQT
jgi:hypothetical protein